MKKKKLSKSQETVLEFDAMRRRRLDDLNDVMWRTGNVRKALNQAIVEYLTDHGWSATWEVLKLSGYPTFYLDDVMKKINKTVGI